MREYGFYGVLQKGAAIKKQNSLDKKNIAKFKKEIFPQIFICEL